MHKIIPVIVSSLIVGAAVVYVVPFGEGLLAQIPNDTVKTVLSNKIVQIAVVGLIASIGVGIFTALASALPAKWRG